MHPFCVDMEVICELRAKVLAVSSDVQAVWLELCKLITSLGHFLNFEFLGFSAGVCVHPRGDLSELPCG